MMKMLIISVKVRYLFSTLDVPFAETCFESAKNDGDGLRKLESFSKKLDHSI